MEYFCLMHVNKYVCTYNGVHIINIWLVATSRIHRGDFVITKKMSCLLSPAQCNFIQNERERICICLYRKYAAYSLLKLWKPQWKFGYQSP